MPWSAPTHLMILRGILLHDAGLGHLVPDVASLARTASVILMRGVARLSKTIE